MSVRWKGGGVGGGEIHGICSVKKDVPVHPSSGIISLVLPSKPVCLSDGMAVGRGAERSTGVELSG